MNESQSKTVVGKSIKEWINDVPVIEDLINYKETLWQNNGVLPFDEAIKNSEFDISHVDDAARRLDRFAAYFKKAFPETKENGGIIESPVKKIPAMQKELSRKYGVSFDSDLLIKLDSHLPISGSIKARGGIYEVLCIAEKIAMEKGALTENDDYSVLDSQSFKDLFSRYSIAVGSTGNLGLSIGIISAKLGFKVSVHMSADARQWKKDMLRSKGVTVIEYQNDYSIAVENGRKEAQKDERCHFIDDENSRTLFLGYSVAAQRLKKQFEQAGIEINKENPLHVYLPCGVGGGPGGVAFGLKTQFGDNVHCYFAEPTNSCCMILGMASGMHNALSVNDFGIDNKTIADGLAVGRASGFIGKQMYPFMDGCYTVSDDRMSAYLKMLADTEGIFLEPSALAGMHGPVILQQKLASLPHGYHLVWAAGGSMVPSEEMEKYYSRGSEVYNKF